jgi:hypothetical protein
MFRHSIMAIVVTRPGAVLQIDLDDAFHGQPSHGAAQAFDFPGGCLPTIQDLHDIAPGLICGHLPHGRQLSICAEPQSSAVRITINNAPCPKRLLRAEGYQTTITATEPKLTANGIAITHGVPTIIAT